MNLLFAILKRLPLSWLRALGRLALRRKTRVLNAALEDPKAAQWLRLQDILSSAASTEFGKSHDFAGVKNVDDFRARVPIATWDDFAPLVDRMVAGEKNILVSEDVLFYATSSGTTGKRKLIPVTSGFVREFRAASFVFRKTVFEHFLESVQGQVLMMHSPHVEDLPSGAQAGSITVALRGEDNSPFDAVPHAVFGIRDFETRYYLCVRFALQSDIRLVTAINPSTVLLYAQVFERHKSELVAGLRDGTLGKDCGDDAAVLRELQSELRAMPGRADDVEKAANFGEALPHLLGLCCWQGGNTGWYIHALKEHYGDLPILDYGYAASEGFFAAPVDVNTAESVLVPNAHFLEFMPEGEEDDIRAGHKSTVLMHELEVGGHYYVVVTNSGGLYRYDMNDVVEVMGKEGNTARVVFRHKGGTMSSITGEKIGESHVARAMKDALQASDSIDGFCIAPVRPLADGPPGYVLVVDGDFSPGLAARFDDALRAHNEEYEAKRKSLRLAPIFIEELAAGAVAAWRQKRVAAGAPDAHVKVPMVSPDGQLVRRLGVSAELLARLM